VDALLVMYEVTELARKSGLAVTAMAVRHDIAPWLVSYDSPQVAVLEQLYEQSAVPFRKADRAFSGYIDAQMVAEKIDAPAFIIGTGGGNKHSADEYVPLANLRKAQKLYEAILQQYIGGRNA
jgi:acetylornithine deacetylase/succinyl-diaminopimelate desuccinylase-like protein